MRDFYALGAFFADIQEAVIGRREEGMLVASDDEQKQLVALDAALAAAKKAGGPWDAAKAFDNSAPIGLIARIEDFPPHLFDDARLVLKVNGEEKQNAPLRSMIFTIPEIIISLSRLFELKAGDLIFTGTPEGVGPLVAEDRVEVTIGALPPLDFTIG